MRTSKDQPRRQGNHYSNTISMLFNNAHQSVGIQSAPEWQAAMIPTGRPDHGSHSLLLAR